MTTLAAALLASASWSAQSREWPSVSGWDVVQSDETCGLFQDFEGDGSTSLIVLSGIDGSIGVQLTNQNWSAKEGERYEISFRVNGQVYSGGYVSGIGRKSGDAPGFFAKMSEAFLDDFAKGSGLTVYRGTTVVDDLSLSGSGAGVAMFRRCVAFAKAETAVAEREKRRLAHIPTDPFDGGQSAAERNQCGSAKPVPRDAAPIWVSDADYPALAQREHRQGIVEFKLTIDKAGVPVSCSITKSSGHADLDDATCRLLSRRAKFTETSEGGTFESKLTWKLPE